jgi:hypothetical protein
VMSARIVFRGGTRYTCSCVDGPGDERSCMPHCLLFYTLPRCSPRTSVGATAQKRYSASRQLAELYRSPRLEEIVLPEKRCNIQSKVKEAGQPREGRLIERQLICSRALSNVAQRSSLVRSDRNAYTADLPRQGEDFDEKASPSTPDGHPRSRCRRL